MANVEAPFGFQLAGFLDGRTGSLGQQTRLMAYDAATIWSGDPVTSLASGYVARSTVGTTQIAGIFIGCTYLSTALGRVVWAPMYTSGSATGDVTVYVVTDPQAVFKVQAGGGSPSVAIPFTAINANANFGLQSGNNYSGQSKAYLDQTTIDPADDTLPFRIVSLIEAPPGAPGTDITAAYNNVLVTFNFQDFRALTGT